MCGLPITLIGPLRRAFKCDNRGNWINASRRVGIEISLSSREFNAGYEHNGKNASGLVRIRNVRRAGAASKMEAKLWAEEP
jgi:hypothetical protein